MGSRGPVPLHSSERERRNDYNIETIEIQGPVDKPELRIEDPHWITQELWDSLDQSAQSQFYEPSDWAYALLTLETIDRMIKSPRISAQMFQGVTSALSDLMVTEGSRRRLRLEIERNKVEAEVHNIADEFKKRMGKA